MQTKRILSWFSVLESTNNVKHAGMGNLFRYLYTKHCRHRSWIDRVIEKIKRVQFFCPTGYIIILCHCFCHYYYRYYYY